MMTSSWLNDQPFYELMQAYRHAPLTPQDEVVTAFNAVKDFIRERAQSDLVDTLCYGYGQGQEHAIADVNAGAVDHLIEPRLSRARKDPKRTPNHAQKI